MDGGTDRHRLTDGVGEERVRPRWFQVQTTLNYRYSHSLTNDPCSSTVNCIGSSWDYVGCPCVHVWQSKVRIWKPQMRSEPRRDMGRDPSWRPSLSTNHWTAKVTSTSLTTVYQKFPSFVHGKKGSSPDSQDGIRMSPSGLGRSLKAVTSKMSPSAKFSSQPSPKTPGPSMSLWMFCLSHTRDDRKINFFCFLCLVYSRFSVFPWFCISYCRGLSFLTDSTLVSVDGW
jgi:hypothetical protein